MKEKKKTIVDHILTFILIIAVGVFCYAGYKLVSIYMEYKEGTDEYNQIAQMAVTVRENEEEQEDDEKVIERNHFQDEEAEMVVEEVSDDITESKEQQEAPRKSEEVVIEVNEVEKIEKSEEPGENSYAVTGGQLAEQVVALLEDIAKTGEYMQKQQVGEPENAQLTETTVSQVLTKPDSAEPVSENVEKTQAIEKVNKESVEDEKNIENIEVTEISEREDKIKESLKAEMSTEEELIRKESEVIKAEKEKEPTREEILGNLKNIIETISSMVKEESLSEYLYRRNEVTAFVAGHVADALLPIASPAIFSIKKLSDSVLSAIEGLKFAAEIRENGLGIEVPLEVDFKVLQEINEDVIGWIYVEAIDSINYPIVKGEDNDEYLHHTYEGKYNFAGTIFIDYENSRDFKDSNTLVYGHNMKNGSMFGQLKSFVNKPEVYENSKYFWILTPNADYRYEIIAAYTTGVRSDTYTLFNSPGEKFLNYIDKIREWSAIETTSRKFTVRDKIVTLSTCTGNESTRFVVQGVRVNTISK